MFVGIVHVRMCELHTNASMLPKWPECDSESDTVNNNWSRECGTLFHLVVATYHVSHVLCSVDHTSSVNHV